MLECYWRKEMKKRHTEEQIVKILSEIEEVGSVREVSRKHNIAEQTIYRWRQVYGDMEVSEVKKLKALEAENARLKRLVADQALDIQILKDVNSKKW